MADLPESVLAIIGRCGAPSQVVIKKEDQPGFLFKKMVNNPTPQMVKDLAHFVGESLSADFPPGVWKDHINSKHAGTFTIELSLLCRLKNAEITNEGLLIRLRSDHE